MFAQCTTTTALPFPGRVSYCRRRLITAIVVRQRGRRVQGQARDVKARDRDETETPKRSPPETETLASPAETRPRRNVKISRRDVCSSRDMNETLKYKFLPRCMEYSRGIAMRKLSVCLSVCQTHELWQNGRKMCPDFYTVRKLI